MHLGEYGQAYFISNEPLETGVLIIFLGLLGWGRRELPSNAA
jgi:hypothetical protein